jgi:hypothetical protein
MGMWNQLLRGAAAGAAGTTALNAVTYADMALRGRPASTTPERSVETLARRLGIDVRARGRTGRHRVQGTAALLGLATGTVVGVGYALVDTVLGAPSGHRWPVAARGLIVTGLALTAANGPMAVVGVTDPREWTVSDWMSDVVPHLAYGLVTASAYAASTERSGRAADGNASWRLAR